MVKKKIFKIIGGIFGTIAISCIIPICIVSCGSSSNNSSSNINSETQNSTTTDTLSNNKNIQSSNVTTENLVPITVSNGATKFSWDKTGLSKIINFNSVNNLISVYNLTKNNAEYNISVSNTENKSFTYQWYQIPVSVFTELNSTQLASTSASSFVSQNIQNWNLINGANKSTYTLNYKKSLDDAFYVCRIVDGNQTLYSKIVWLRETVASNPLNINSYILYYDSYDSSMNSNGNSEINVVQPSNSNVATLEAPWDSQISFTLSLPVYQTNNYYVLWKAGSFTSQLMSLNNSSSKEYNFYASVNTTNVSVEIFNSNGQILNISNGGTIYTIAVEDPLQLENDTLNWTSNIPQSSINNGNAFVSKGQQITINLSLENTNNKSLSPECFDKYEYYVQYKCANSTSSWLPLSNKSSWTYTFDCIQGYNQVNINIEDPYKNTVNIFPSSPYNFVNQYVTLQSQLSPDSWNSSDIEAQGVCVWNNITYSWQESTNGGNTWSNLLTDTIQNSGNDYLSYDPTYNITSSNTSYTEYRLVITNPFNKTQEITSNIISGSVFVNNPFVRNTNN